MSDKPTDNGEQPKTIEVPTWLMERVREECENYGFPTDEGFVQHAIKFRLAKEPDLSEEQTEELLETRRQVNRGETYSMEEVMEEFNE